MRYLLKTINGGWEEVAEVIYNQRQFVVDITTEEHLYTGDSVLVDNSKNFTFNGKISSEELSKLMRYFNIQVPTGIFQPIITNDIDDVAAAPPRLILRGKKRFLFIAQTGLMMEYRVPKKVEVKEAA